MIVCASVNVLFASETNGKRPPWYSRIHGRPPRADKAVPSHDGDKKCWFSFSNCVCCCRRAWTTSACWKAVPSWNAYQSIDQSINRSITRCITQWINRLINRSIDHSLDQSINESIDQSVEPWINESVYRSNDQSMNPSINLSIQRSIIQQSRK